MPKVDPSVMPTVEPEKPDMCPEPGQKSANLDDDEDDGDLPEFDFDSACGISKAPGSIFLGYGHQTHFQVPPFNQQVPVDGLKNPSGPMPPPVTKNMDIRQAQHASGFPGRTLNTYQEPTTTPPPRFGELNSKKKPADVPSLSQNFSGKAYLVSSSSGSFSKKSHWDDDDDMPEWCPPDLEHLDVPKPSISTRVLPPVPWPATDTAKELPLTPPLPMNTSCPPLQSQSFSPGYHPGTLAPRSVSPAPVHNNVAGFVPIDFRPQLPHPNHSMRPPAPNFGTKPPVSDISWQWNRH